ncbi:MAG: Putative transmembrane protein [uncultured Caballeronia sp.]|nr:MAG: Putative transmembrane protein [uncultured Caballeronia sp.]
MRLYLTVFVAGLFEHLGLVPLPDTLAVLGSPWVIDVAAALAVVEFFADKIPAFDFLWDAIHTFIRIPVGVGAFGHADPALLTVAALAGGTLAGAAHLAKAGTRALINLSPEPVSSWVASATEDFGALLGIMLALFVPLLCLVLIIVFLLCAGLGIATARERRAQRLWADGQARPVSTCALIGV